MRQLITTSDGSHSIFDDELNVTFHSRHGALQESQHIFINAGLQPLLPKHPSINILEIGFGTGLNSLLTYISAHTHTSIFYNAIDNAPLTDAQSTHLNYCERLGRLDLKQVFSLMHSSPWNEPVHLDRSYTLLKQQADATTITFNGNFHLVYFDAFDPVTQPELWTPVIFNRIREAMAPSGKLVTYSSKSSVQKSLRDAGFEVAKLKGPPGKREFVVATAR